MTEEFKTKEEIIDSGKEKGTNIHSTNEVFKKKGSEPKKNDFYSKAKEKLKEFNQYVYNFQKENLNRSRELDIKEKKYDERQKKKEEEISRIEELKEEMGL